MDIKDIVSKAVAGEDVSTLTKDFTSEQQVEYTKALKATGDEELKRVSGLRTAAKILEDKNKETPPPVDNTEAIRAEQILKAKNKFVADFKLTPEEAAKLDESFKSVDSKKFDAEFIYNDFKKAYVNTDPDKFLEAQKIKNDLDRGAYEFNSNAAGSTSGGQGGGASDKKYSPQAYQMVKEASSQGIPMTLEQAETGLKAGNGWKKTG